MFPRSWRSGTSAGEALATAAPPSARSAAEAGPTPTRAGIDRRATYVLLSILVLAGGLRLYGLATLPFEQDELYTVRSATQFGERFTIRPVYFALQHLILQIAPPTPVVLRIPPFVFGVLGVLVTWLLARRVFGTTAAHIAALMVALSPWHLSASQFARYYTLLYLLAGVFFLLLLRAQVSDRRHLFLLALGVFTVGALTHPTFIFPAAGVAAAIHLVRGDGKLGWLPPSRQALINLWLPLAAAAIVGYALLSVLDLRHAVWNRDGRGLIAMLRLVPAIVQWATPEIMAAAAVGTVFLIIAGRNAEHRRWGLMTLLGCSTTLVLLVALSFRTDVYADYAMSMLPLVYVTVGGFVQRVSELMASRGNLFAMGMGILLAGGVLPGTVSHLSDGTRFDYRPAYAYLQRYGGDRLVMGEPIVIQRYYAPELRFQELRMTTRQLESAIEAEGGFWLVGSYRRYGMALDYDGQVEAWVDANCRKVMQTQRQRLDFRTYRVELRWCGEGAPPAPGTRQLSG